MLCIFQKKNLVNLNKYQPARHFWDYLNKVFNSLDEDRRKLLGCDRTCAEWLLRNGAAVKWTTSTDFLNDYNALPPEDTRLLIKEVDATNSSISHYGFPHFVGCKHIDKITLHKCLYLENPALPLLKTLSDTLKFLQVTSCGNITEEGLNSLSNLSNLSVLIIGDFPYVKNRDVVLTFLNKELPKCQITFK